MQLQLTAALQLAVRCDAPFGKGDEAVGAGIAEGVPLALPIAPDHAAHRQ